MEALTSPLTPPFTPSIASPSLSASISDPAEVNVMENSLDSSSPLSFEFIVRTTSFLDRKKFRPVKKGKEQARGAAGVNRLVSHRCLSTLALSSRYVQEQNHDELEDSLNHSTPNESGYLTERIIAEDSGQGLVVQFAQDGRFLVLRIKLDDLDDSELSPTQDIGSEKLSSGLVTDASQADEDSELISQFSLEQYPSKVARVLRALLIQSAVSEVSPVLLSTSSRLTVLLPALIEKLLPLVRSHRYSTIKLTTEPSVWPGQKKASAENAVVDSNDFPPPPELYRIMLSALTESLKVTHSRESGSFSLQLLVELGRRYAYASIESHVRMRQPRYRSWSPGTIAEVVLFAMGEVHLKLGNKTAMINDVMRRVRYRCGNLASWSERESNIHFVVYPRSPEHVSTLVEIVRSCPGVERVWRATRVDVSYAPVLNAAITLLDKLGDWRDLDISIKNNARTVFSSKGDLKKQLSADLGARFKRIIHSNKRGTDATLELKLADDNAYVSVASYSGIGGLPINKLQQSVVALLSGGMDSPVAAYMMMKRGCHNHLQMKSAVSDKISRIAGQLTRFQDHLYLYMVPFAELQAEIIERVPANERMLVYRRFMTMIASRIADYHQAKFLVLGDAFSQVASQTVHNLAAIYERTDKPILAPLIGMNKEETMNIARSIGTFDLSALPYGDCCSFFLDAHPALHMRGEKLLLDEYISRIDVIPAVQRALDSAQILKLKRSEDIVSTFEVRPMRAPAIAPHLQDLLDREADGAICLPVKALIAPVTEPHPKPKSALFTPTSATATTVEPVSVSSQSFAPLVPAPSFNGEVYLDNAATTACDHRVVTAMLPLLTSTYGNPNSLHPAGDRARNALDSARSLIAKALGADSSEVVITSGGTESNTLALLGLLRQWQRTHVGIHPHIVTLAIEHASILEPLQRFCQSSEGKDAVLTLLQTDKFGVLNPSALSAALTQSPPGSVALVSIAHANNEIGSVQDLTALVGLAKKVGAFVHVDACQSFTKILLDVRTFPVDLMTINAHKIHGPKGVGALYVRKGVILEPVARGGSQEWNLRAGTSNVAGAVGFAEAITVALNSASEDVPRMRGLCTRLWEGLRKGLNDTVVLNGPPIGDSRLCNNLSVQFLGVDGDSLLKYLSRHGICCSSASACHAEVDVPSHVLLAIGCTPKQAKSTLRLSTSRFTTEEEIDKALATILSYFSR